MLRIRSLAWGVGLLAASAMLAGCTTSPLSRIDADRALYESWPLEIQQAVLDGRVVSGMTPEQVEMSVGKPSAKTVNNSRKGMEDVWIYRAGGSGSGLGNMTIGGGIGPIGVQQRRGGGSSGEEYEVVFVDGQVVRSTFPQ